VRAVLRRGQRAQQTSLDTGERPLVYDDLRIDPQTRLVVARGREITLTAREFDLLWLLARHPRQVFNRDQLLDVVWGVTEYIDASTITVHVRRLREKIEDDPANPRTIQTVWGVGYKFEP
jgi:DNA-binding response OmpR family regulator